MYIQQIRSATVKIRYGGTTFFVDPWLQDQGTGVSVKAVIPEMQGVKCPMDALPDTPERILADVDCCLVTHLHFDHFSPDYLPPGIRLIAQNKEDADTIQKLGFVHTGCFEADVLRIGDVTIHKTTAVHGDRDLVVRKMGEACGYVLEAPGEKTLYLAGDTVYCQEVAEVIQRYQPEVILLNCCGATTPLGRLIMDLEDVKRVCEAAPDAVVIASHLDSVNHATVTSEDVRKFVAEKRLRQVLVPCGGEIMEV